MVSCVIEGAVGMLSCVVAGAVGMLSCVSGGGSDAELCQWGQQGC